MFFMRDALYALNNDCMAMIFPSDLGVGYNILDNVLYDVDPDAERADYKIRPSRRIHLFRFNRVIDEVVEHASLRGVRERPVELVRLADNKPVPAYVFDMGSEMAKTYMGAYREVFAEAGRKLEKIMRQPMVFSYS